MWRACGLRVSFLVGWKNVEGEIVTTSLDFNEKIKGGERFSAVSKIRKEWEEYIGVSFEPQGTPESDVDTMDEDSNFQVKRLRKPKEDPVKAVMQDDGSIWIADMKRLSREGLQKQNDPLGRTIYQLWYHILAGFTCGQNKAAVPFKRLPTIGHQMIEPQYLPPDFEFPGDLSHMRKSEATTFLEFIRAWQETHPDDVFRFHQWLNDSGELEMPVDVGQQGEDTSHEKDLPKGHGRSRSGKGKHAMRSKRNKSTEINSGDEEEMDDASTDHVGPLNDLQPPTPESNLQGMLYEGTQATNAWKVSFKLYRRMMLRLQNYY
ncbi:hypothetical protein JVU11DRAFT_10851 [Chiua virens]|nr:hypothetical protein JVU11DRAFT_10851 [Chiua virens]